MSLIALLTDFGTKDYFVGAVKGAIFSINRQAQIVDITHEIAPQNLRAASFNLRACYKSFPSQTIFVAVVDPGVGSARGAILVETADYFFVAPDNGLLSFIFNETKDFRVINLTNEKYFAENLSRTFHGRDVFAPVAAHLSNGVEPTQFGAEAKDFVRFASAAPHRISPAEIEAEIIHIDRFGNLVTNLKAEDLPASFALQLNETTVEKHQRFYAEAENDEVFSIFGSAGFLEIVAFQYSAARILRAQTGQKFLLKILNS